jgi:hypothetical protein
MSLSSIAKDAKSSVGTFSGLRAMLAAISCRDSQMFANSADTELAPGQEVAIDMANAAAGDGWHLLASYGDFPHSMGLQRFQKNDAENIVRDFESFPNALIRGFGIPFYVGHPDHPAFAQTDTDRRAYGRIKKLEARDSGLFGQVKWNAHGESIIANAEYHGISPNWRMRREGAVYRPISLKSVGFTNSPVMPIPAPFAANSDPSKNQSMNKELLALLGLPETATEAEFKAKLTEVANSLQATQAALSALKLKETEFANAQTKITTLEGENTALKGQVQTLTTEKQSAETNFANARQSQVKLLLDQAQKEGRISQADRTAFETEFANAATFDGALTRLNGAKKQNLPTGDKSRVEGDRKRVNDSADRQRQIHEFCNSKMKDGLSYDEAFAIAKREKAELFANMQKPGQDE